MAEDNVLKTKPLEGILVSTSPKPEIDLQRVHASVRKYEEDDSRIVLLMGNLDGFEDEDQEQVNIMYRQMVILGIPKDYIKKDTRPSNTMGKVFYASETIRQKGIGKMIIASDILHAERLKMLFRRYKRENGYLPKDFETESYSLGINDSYPEWKAFLAYAKDRIFPLKKK